MLLQEAILIVQSLSEARRFRKGDPINNELKDALKSLRKHSEVIYDLNRARQSGRLDNYKLSAKEKLRLMSIADAVETMGKNGISSARMIRSTALKGMKSGKISSASVLLISNLLNRLDMGDFGDEFSSL